MSIDFQVNLNQPLNFTAVILAHATLRLRYATPQSRQSPDGSFLKNIKRAVKEQIYLFFHRSFCIFQEGAIWRLTRLRRSTAEPKCRMSEYDGSEVKRLIQVRLKINVYICIFLWGEAPNGGAAIAATELHGFIRRQ